MSHSSKLSRVGISLLVALPVMAMQPPPSETPAPDDPGQIEHPPELTPEAKKALEEHCAKHENACEPPMSETPPVKSTESKRVEKPDKEKP